MSLEWHTPNVLIACYFNFIIGIISIIATLLAILAYFKSLTIRQSYQNLLLLNLLINAMIYSIDAIIIYGYGAIMKNSNILSIEWICNLNGFIDMFCCGMEIYALMCIALERYYAIKKQQPLTLKQIIGLLMFGWIETGLITSIPFWLPFFSYSISDAKFYCAYSFSDRSQMGGAIVCTVHVILCILVICYCYITIYQFYSEARRKRIEPKKDSILQSHVGTSQKKDEEKEYRVFTTTVLLIGWTLMGWAPMLLMLIYKIITGNLVNDNWDITSCVMLTLSVCGDSIILLVYDKRWKSSIHEMIQDMKQWMNYSNSAIIKI